MRAEIEFSPSYSVLNVHLDPGELVRAEPGSMVALSGVEMDTKAGGRGLTGGFRRMLGGESFMVNVFRGGPQGGWVSLAPAAPGDVRAMPVSPDEDVLVQSGSYLASDDNVRMDASFQGLRGMFSGEGLFFLRATAEALPGFVYCNSYGAIREIPVEPAQEVVVDTGHLVAFTGGVDYSIGKVGGLKSIVAGGEGLVLRFRGERNGGGGRVWIQTRDMPGLAGLLLPFLPRGKK